jgi:asparagine synthase (glutamine-hydrolysing)
MCGIVGVCGIYPEDNCEWLALASEQLSHRGPDDAGEWWTADKCVGLAHRRLSIMDLSPSGHQPMHLPMRGLSVVFNGEIYNHDELRGELSRLGFAFQTQCDTEVLLLAYAAWGEECLARFNGMFAFGLYDAHQQRLFLARDRAGEKPLFYHLANGRLQFASELKALLANPANSRCIDAEALDCYLAMGYVPGELCMLQGYKKLPPAHAMRFDLQSGQAQVWRYWQLPELSAVQNTLDEEVLLSELEVLLEDAVRRQMVADVPVGVLLSGGVDSSLLTAMAVRSSSRVQTFTISFPGYGKFDETEHARLIARHFGTQHTELSAGDIAADLLQRLARQFDEPIVDSSIIPTFLVSHLVRQSCAVALGGDGGDELFGGYSHYSRLLWMHQKLGRIPYRLRRGMALSGGKLLPVGFKGRNWVQGLGTNLDNDLPLIASYFDAATRQRLLAAHMYCPSAAEAVRRRCMPQNADILQRATRMDFAHYLAEDILVKVDRASMLNSLEMRAPFLDYRLIEFAFAKVPSRLKATPTDKKILLKRLTSRLLPPEFDQHRKQGFSIPLGDWLKDGKFRKLFREVLLDSQCSFDADTVGGLLRGQDKGLRNGERLFALVMFELWRREYAITF